MLRAIEAPKEIGREGRPRLSCDLCGKTYKYQHTCLKPHARCEQCGRLYKNRHTCFGKGHRSPAVKSSLQATPLYLGFWTNHEECSLFQYYITKLCATRTLFTDDKRNSYLNLVRSTPCAGVNAAVYGLAALYLGRQEQEIKYINRALKVLGNLVQESGAVSSIPQIIQIIQIIQLLIHYQVVTRQAEQRWSIHAKALAKLQERVSVNHDPFLFVAFESILKLTAPKNNQPVNDGISIAFLQECKNPEEVLDFGCSRELLCILGEINLQEESTRKNADRRVSAGKNLLDRCRCITQRATERNDDHRRVIEMIANSYLMMARVVIYCRLLGYTRRHKTLRALCESLMSLVLDLPTDAWFSAQYPLAPVFWGMLFSQEKGEACGKSLRKILSGNPTNTTRALDTADAIKRYHQPTNEQEIYWFEEMLIELGIEELSLG